MHFMSYKILKSRFRPTFLMVAYLMPTVSSPSMISLKLPMTSIVLSYCPVVRAHVPGMTLDKLFEQKSDVAKVVLEELEKVMKS